MLGHSFTNNVKSSLGLRSLRDDYEVQAGVGLNSEKQKKIQKRVKTADSNKSLI